MKRYHEIQDFQHPNVTLNQALTNDLQLQLQLLIIDNKEITG